MASPVAFRPEFEHVEDASMLEPAAEVIVPEVNSKTKGAEPSVFQDSDSEFVIVEENFQLQQELNEDQDPLRMKETDVPTLADMLAPYAHAWEKIGIQLGFTLHELRTLRGNHGDDLIHCLTDMLSSWAQWTPETSHKKYASLKDLEKSLQSKAVNLGIAAKQLGKQWPALLQARPHSVQPAITSLSSPHLSITNGDYQDTLRSQIEEKQVCSEKFRCLINKIQKSLDDREISVKEVASVLKSLCNIESIYQTKQKPKFSKRFEEIDEAESIDDLMLIVIEFSSFFHYELVEHIAESLGTKDDKEELKHYKEQLTVYAKQKLFKAPPDISDARCDDQRYIYVTLGDKFKHRTLSDLKLLLNKLCNVFGVHSRLMHLCHIEPHILKLTVVLPFDYDTIFPLTSSQEDCLTALGVLVLSCGLYHFVHQVELPCFGRSFNLGTFYDYQSGNYSLLNICKKTPPKKCEPHVSFNYEVMSSDNLQDKTFQNLLHFGLSSEVTSRFLDGQCSSKSVVRVFLKYESTSYIKELVIEKLAKGQCNVCDRATHVVSKVLYGLCIVFAFDHEIAEGEDYDYVHENMMKMVRSLGHIKEMENSNFIDTLMADTEEVKKYECRIYSDIADLSDVPCTFPEAVKVYRGLPHPGSEPRNQTIGPIALKVWLHPLSKLDDKFKALNEVQSMLGLVENQASDTLSKHSDILSKFDTLYEKLTMFAELIANYRNRVDECIAQMLPQIHEEKIDEAEITKIVKDTNASPFSSKHLSSWLKQIDKEIITLKDLYQHMTDIEFASTKDVQSIKAAVDSDYVVFFAFNLSSSDSTLKSMECYLQSEETQSHSALPVSKDNWYENTKLINCRIKQFKTFGKVNLKRNDVHFYVTNAIPGDDITENMVGTIVLYKGAESSCMKWEPPGAPGKPQVSEIAHHSVQLEWAKPHYGYESVVCYTITYRIIDSPDSYTTSTTGTEERVTVSGLIPHKRYEFKVQPQCCCGIGAESEPSDPIEVSIVKSNVPKCSVENCNFTVTHHISKPEVTSVTHNSVKLIWTNLDPFNDDVFYTVFYREPDNSSKEWKQERTEVSKETMTITGLAPSTRYVFKVRSELDGGVGVESEVSNPIKTEECICKPGKPYAIMITHNSIILAWDIPQCDSEQIDNYIVSYHSKDELLIQKSKKWKNVMTNGAENKLNVTELSPQTEYIFKVRPIILENYSIGVESDISEIICTKSTSPPGKPTTINVTHDSIKVQWTSPDYGSDQIDSYSVYYQSNTSPQAQWKYHKTKGACLETTICGLNLNSSYLFKVHPECKGGQCTESEVSDPIETKATSLPGKPEIYDAVHNSIAIRWTHPEQGSENIELYTIHYRSMDDPVNWSSLKGTREPSQKISNLTPNTKYVFKVHPQCKSGIGTESAISDVFDTKEACRPGKPKLKYAAHDKVELLWSKPEHYQKEIHSYHIKYRKASDQSHKWKDYEIKADNKYPDNQTCSIPRLDVNVSYIFKVYPQITGSKMRFAMESEESDIIKTMSTSPPGKPVVVAKTYCSITLKWTKPKVGVERIEKYEVKYHQTNPCTEFTYKYTGGDQAQLTIKALTPKTKYVFRVIPICDDGLCGSESDHTEPIETDGTCKPGKPQAIRVTHDSVQLKWDKPEYHRKQVDGYSLSYYVYNDESRKGKKHEIREVKNTDADVTDLAPNTTYVFKVHPLCKQPSIGLEDSISDPITTKITSPPGKPREYNAFYSSIQIEWDRPHFGHSNVKSYTVIYKSLNGNEVECGAGFHESKTIGNLRINIAYQFKVRCECVESNRGSESEYSDIIYTKATSPPGTPTVDDKAPLQVNGLKIKWTRPLYGAENIIGYTVKYCKASDPDKWMTWTAKVGNQEHNITITGLEAEEHFRFKVQAECKLPRVGSESEVSGPIKVQGACKPGKPEAFNVTHNSINLSWGKPVHGSRDIEYYLVSYHETQYSTKPWNKCLRSKSSGEFINISGLKPNTSYTFKVNPKCKSDILTTESEHVSFQTSPRPFAERMRDKWYKKCNIIEVGPPEVIRVPVTLDLEQDTFTKCHIGTNIITSEVKEKVVMLVGATGAGKTTLINSIVNYIYGVEFGSTFRFTLITNESVHSQAHSQTPKITAYTFYESQLNFALTIVDTPGFGDTKGIQRDQEITDHIRRFFSVKPPYGIDQIHVVGFVTQAALPRLTPTQKYVFGSIMAIFGKDIESNIFLMSTFADMQQPMVLAAIEQADIRCSKCFKFNNSALYAQSNSSSQPFWLMNQENLDLFLRELEITDPKSLTLTKKVLERREQLETHVVELQTQLRTGLSSIQELQVEQRVIETHGRDLHRVDGTTYRYEVEVAVAVKVELPEGQYVTNCTKCNTTCHFPCTISDNTKKYNCAAMGGHYLFRDRQSKCRICRGCCSWELHQNDQHKYEIQKKKETRTLEDLIKSHAQRNTDSEADCESDVDLNTDMAKQIESRIAKKLEKLKKEVLDIVVKINEVLRELNDIALKPSPLNEVKYIELLIESESRHGEGSPERISILEQLKERASLITQAKRCSSSGELLDSEGAYGIGGVLMMGSTD